MQSSPLGLAISLESAGEMGYALPICKEQDVVAGGGDTRCHCGATLLLPVLAPATYKPDSVSELAANETKGKIILSLT